MICMACHRHYGFHYSEEGNPQITAKAHAITKAAGGVKLGEMDLCYYCHVEQHQVGMKTFVKKHPHLVELYPELERFK